MGKYENLIETNFGFTNFEFWRIYERIDGYTNESDNSKFEMGKYENLIETNFGFTNFRRISTDFCRTESHRKMHLDSSDFDDFWTIRILTAFRIILDQL